MLSYTVVIDEVSYRKVDLMEVEFATIAEIFTSNTATLSTARGNAFEAVEVTVDGAFKKADAFGTSFSIRMITSDVEAYVASVKTAFVEAFTGEEKTNLCSYKADSRFAPSQWETALLCNDVSHSLGARLESSLENRIRPNVIDLNGGLYCCN